MHFPVQPGKRCVRSEGRIDHPDPKLLHRYTHNLSGFSGSMSRRDCLFKKTNEHRLTSLYPGVRTSLIRESFILWLSPGFQLETGYEAQGIAMYTTPYRNSSSTTRTIDGARHIEIGNTPVVSIRVRLKHSWRTIHLKLESHNPAGSSKDRTAASLIGGLEKKGLLIGSDTTIIESSSGNLGVSLAMICRRKNLRFVAVVDPKTTVENLKRMRDFGAEFEKVDWPDESGGYLLSRIHRVKELCAQRSNFVWPNQYQNPDNPSAHYSTTGPEILSQMNGCLEAVFVAASTGGTLAGISRFLREASPSTEVIGVDAVGSAALGGVAGHRKLIGIGSAIPSSFIGPKDCDVKVLVSDRDAFSVCRWLKNRLGLNLGGSAGAVVFACIKHLASKLSIGGVLCLCPDGGENYKSTIYSDEWLVSSGFDLSYEPFDEWPDIEAV